MKKGDKSVVAKSKNKNLSPFAITLFIILLLYALSLFFVIYFGLLTSIKTKQEYDYGNPLTGKLSNVLGFPDIKYNQFVAETLGGSYGLFDNYKLVLQTFNYNLNNVSYITATNKEITHLGGVVGIGDFLFNTFMYAIFCPLLTTIISAVSGFLCCKYKYKYSRFLYTALLVTMTIPLIGTQASTVSILQKAGLYDTYLSMIVMNMHFGGLYFFVFFAFFQGLSDTYIEAAEIDGASQVTILVRIILPLAWKTMLTVYIIQLVGLWNNYEAPLLYYPTKPTLAYGIWLMANGSQFPAGTDKVVLQSAPVKVAGCMILCLPTLIMFICLRNVIMGNLTLGGIKE